jgi:hypothetical protein
MKDCTVRLSDRSSASLLWQLLITSVGHNPERAETKGTHLENRSPDDELNNR